MISRSKALDEHTISTLEATFSQFAKGKEESAALFYERLFALDPSLRRLFTNTEMKTQQAKLMAALAMVVGNLRNFEKVAPVLENLAVKHMAYGVQESHYAIVGDALIQTLALSFGSAFTREIRAMWIAAYGAVSGVMIDAARRHEATVQAAE
jgi:hemoglobin-like flavoprotein